MAATLRPKRADTHQKRICWEGVDKIIAISVIVHGKAGMETEVIPDTTVQEKNITFPIGYFFLLILNFL